MGSSGHRAWICFGTFSRANPITSKCTYSSKICQSRMNTLYLCSMPGRMFDSLNLISMCDMQTTCLAGSITTPPEWTTDLLSPFLRLALLHFQHFHLPCLQAHCAWMHKRFHPMHDSCSGHALAAVSAQTVRSMMACSSCEQICMHLLLSWQCGKRDEPQGASRTHARKGWVPCCCAAFYDISRSK